MTSLELLAPARNLHQGKLAIDAGADAVYIGSARFGARAQAGNSIADIAELVQYAHLFGSKVFVAFNTILFDAELAEAEQHIWQLYDIGVDALIIQDMGILEMKLPPIALHASTQTNNVDLAKILFLQNVGFTRVVLARELTVIEIENLAKETSIELEAFVHGALCVSYSGQCYLSQHLAQRSGNRGECIQACRASYTLTDNSGKVIVNNKHLLSLKDLNATNSLEQMALAGVKSFKIEGRLKDAAYVVNTVAWYRTELNKIIAKHPSLFSKSSSGSSKYEFIPDLERTFNRGYTQYFLEGRTKEIASPNTQKAIGQKIGKVIHIEAQRLQIETKHPLANGDGLCFFDSRQQLQGFRVNKIEGSYLYPAQMPQVTIGCELFRNNDTNFERLIDTGAAKRNIVIDFILTETETGILLHVTDEDQISVEINKAIDKIPAKNEEANQQSQQKQLRKTGDTCYSVQNCKIDCNLFMPLSSLNELRREILALLSQARQAHFVSPKVTFTPNNTAYPDLELNYTSNISNRLARAFYERHQVSKIEPAFELLASHPTPLLMTTRHCLRFDQQLCPIHHGSANSNSVQYPLWLHDGKKRYRLEFDCKKCLMRMYSE